MPARHLREHPYPLTGIVVGRLFAMAAIVCSATAWTVAYPAAGTAAEEPCVAPNGYRMAGADGGVFSFGNVPYLGSISHLSLNKPVVGIVDTPSRNGYWLVASDGGVFAFGDAPFLGSMADTKMNAPVVGLARTPSGRGYWLASEDGGVFAFGDAAFRGSAANLTGIRTVTAIAATSTGGGYWLLRLNTTVLAYGDARAFTKPATAYSSFSTATAISTPPIGSGYWIVLEDGTVLAYGDALDLGGYRFERQERLGDGVVIYPNELVPAIGLHPTAAGYALASARGGIEIFGDAVRCSRFSLTVLNKPMVGIT